jgi:hypothetical protein
LAQRFIPVADFLAALPEIAAEGGIRALSERIAASGEMGFHAAERRLGSIARGEQQLVGVGLADRILVALDRPHTFPDLESDYVPPPSTECEDCGQEIEPDVMPIDLFRHDPTALEGRVWNKTTGKWVHRPGRARAGGRRFRPWHLCRSCRADAIRQRALNGSSNGRRQHLRTKDRVEPRRGGRPRLLSDNELRAAYRIYVTTGLSRREIAKRLWTQRGTGTHQGYEQSLLYGWRRLGLKLRTLAEQIAISRHGAKVGWQPHVKQRCTKKLRNGRRCSQWARRDGGQEDGLCWEHNRQERRNHGNKE